jgi:hypothetical protein
LKLRAMRDVSRDTQESATLPQLHRGDTAAT